MKKERSIKIKTLNGRERIKRRAAKEEICDLDRKKRYRLG